MSPAEEAFGQELVKRGGRVSEAYRAAFPEQAKEMTSRQVRDRASSLRDTKRMKAYIASLAAPVSAKIARDFDITVERIAAELAAIGFLDPLELFDEVGNLRPMQEIPPQIRAAIASIETTVQRDGVDAEGKPAFVTVRKVRFWDKNSALGNLAKWKKMLIERKEIGAPGEFEGMTDEEVDAELAALEARDTITRARSAAMRTGQQQARGKVKASPANGSQ